MATMKRKKARHAWARNTQAQIGVRRGVINQTPLRCVRCGKTVDLYRLDGRIPVSTGDQIPCA